MTGKLRVWLSRRWAATLRALMRKADLCCHMRQAEDVRHTQDKVEVGEVEHLCLPVEQQQSAGGSQYVLEFTLFLWPTAIRSLMITQRAKTKKTRLSSRWSWTSLITVTSYEGVGVASEYWRRKVSEGARQGAAECFLLADVVVDGHQGMKVWSSVLNSRKPGCLYRWYEDVIGRRSLVRREEVMDAFKGEGLEPA
ncbi:hypothetical protein Efla_007176 [Eimeria flavescens]